MKLIHLQNLNLCSYLGAYRCKRLASLVVSSGHPLAGERGYITL